MGGQVPAILDNLPASLALIKAGKIRALAVSSPRRLEVLPDVPTFDEAGIKGYEVSGWGAVWVPAGTPQAIVQRLNLELNAALKSPACCASWQTTRCSRAAARRRRRGTSRAPKRSSGAM
jgi:tripartite-type tricarboxylate transporter receptor subunit TctC